MAGNDIVQIHSPKHRKGRRVIIGNLARGGQRSKQAIYIAYPLCPAMFSYLFLMYGKHNFRPDPDPFSIHYNENRRPVWLFCQFRQNIAIALHNLSGGIHLLAIMIQNKIAHFLLKKECYYKPSQKIMSSILKTA